jgi:signal transduction histidine kinase
MVTPPSEEFLELCQAQLSLLQQTLGVALGVVYLTEPCLDSGEVRLVPVSVHPQEGFLAPALTMTPRLLKSLPSLSAAKAEATTNTALEMPQRQMLLPLSHGETVLGLLVIGREDRPWQKRERMLGKKVAKTLALARHLDQQPVWLSKELDMQYHWQRQQQEQIANLLHQIRNPLTAVKTFAKLVLRRLLPGDGNQELVGGIVQESDRLQNLLVEVDQIVKTPTYCELPGGVAASLPPGRVENLAEVLAAVVVAARAIAQERGLDFQASMPEQMPRLAVKESSLREVLSNLIDNALKYTPTGGQVYLKVVEQSHRVGIAVSNTGSEIPAEDLTRLFERHYRGQQADGAIPGTGLGLAIAKELVEQAGGSIEVFSPASLDWAIGSPEGTLTTFVVWWPI